MCLVIQIDKCGRNSLDLATTYSHIASAYFHQNNLEKVCAVISFSLVHRRWKTYSLILNYVIFKLNSMRLMYFFQFSRSIKAKQVLKLFWNKRFWKRRTDSHVPGPLRHIYKAYAFDYHQNLLAINTQNWGMPFSWLVKTVQQKICHDCKIFTDPYTFFFQIWFIIGIR